MTLDIQNKKSHGTRKYRHIDDRKHSRGPETPWIGHPSRDCVCVSNAWYSKQAESWYFSDTKVPSHLMTENKSERFDYIINIATKGTPVLSYWFSDCLRFFMRLLMSPLCVSARNYLLAHSFLPSSLSKAQTLFEPTSPCLIQQLPDKRLQKYLGQTVIHPLLWSIHYGTENVFSFIHYFCKFSFICYFF